MKTIQINIGLSTKSGRNIDAETAAGDIRHILNNSTVNFILKEGTCTEGAEPVLCALVETEDIQDCKRRIYLVAIDLQQECIAIAYDSEHGELIGPKPYETGFNPEFFQFLEWPDNLWSAPASEWDAADDANAETPAERIERHTRVAKEAIGF
jgi:hypothetical protein